MRLIAEWRGEGLQIARPAVGAATTVVWAVTAVQRTRARPATREEEVPRPRRKDNLPEQLLRMLHTMPPKRRQERASARWAWSREAARRERSNKGGAGVFPDGGGMDGTGGLPP